MIYPLIRRRTCLMAGCALTFFSATAMADDALPVLESVYAISVPYDETVAQPDAWRFTLGAGVVNLPTFSGASGTTTDAIPVLAATYGRYFIGANPDAAALIALGGYVYRDSNWRVGLAVTYDFVEPRKESDDAHLQGLGDIDRTAWAEAFVVYTFDWISARSSVLTDIGGKQRGTRVTLDVNARYLPSPQWVLMAGPGLTWGSSEYNRTLFGVDADQSARSTFPVYSLGSGLNSLRFSVGAAYRPDVHWTIGADVAASWLQGDSGNSPIVQKKNQVNYGLIASYRF